MHAAGFVLNVPLFDDSGNASGTIDLEGQLRGFNFPDIDLLSNQYRDSLGNERGGPLVGLARLQATFESATFAREVLRLIGKPNQEFIVYTDMRTETYGASGFGEDNAQGKHTIRARMVALTDLDYVPNAEVTFGGRLEMSAWKYEQSVLTSDVDPSAAPSYSGKTPLWEIDFAQRKYTVDGQEMFGAMRKNLGISGTSPPNFSS